MKERPILFSGSMVRAILDGRKTQTRRVVTPQPDWSEPSPCCETTVEGWQGSVNRAMWSDGGTWTEDEDPRRCPFGKPGDRLWVRETWAPCGRQSYPAADMVRHGDDGAIHREGWDRSPPSRWRPSIFMPRWASRVTLEIVGVRVERLQEISHADAQTEGISALVPNPAAAGEMPNGRAHYHQLWDSLNAKRGFGWDTNPWVWVVEFKRAP